MKNSAVSKLALLLPFCALLFPTSAFAENGQAEYDAGRLAYHHKNYKGASEHFAKSIEEGNRTPPVWLYAGHTFMALGQPERALRTYETLIKNFKDSIEAKTASDSINLAKQALEKQNAVPIAVPAATGEPAKKIAVAATKAPVDSGEKGLKDRVIVHPPKFGHAAVSQRSLRAVHEAVANLPAHLRKKLDEGGATINLAPNMIDRWPESLNEELEKAEGEEPPTMAELPGRIYGRDMWVYESPKERGTTNLKNARPAAEIKHTVYNESFQVLDELMTICKAPAVVAQYNAEKAGVAESYHAKLATFLKDDEWGVKETCSELAAEIFGQGDEFSVDLNRCFPKLKRLLQKKLAV
ncbi:MAG: hypothetical protein SGJ27_06870 [Candidatus Melainabacteria bacterium]|nr:hypothetical protein [Candidatus Melainabacteria bacterium]